MATTKKPKFTPSNFEELKSQYLMDIMAVVTTEDVPQEMIVNWDQTAVKYIPVSNCNTFLFLNSMPYTKA